MVQPAAELAPQAGPQAPPPEGHQATLAATVTPSTVVSSTPTEGKKTEGENKATKVVSINGDLVTLEAESIEYYKLHLLYYIIVESAWLFIVYRKFRVFTNI